MRARRTPTTRTFLLGLTAVLIATCAAAAGPASAARHGLVTAGVPRQAPPAGAPTGAVVAGLTAVGYEVSRTAEPGRNWVMSPLSVAYAFAMARAGASGETAAQLDRLFGFPERGTHEAFNALDSQVAAEGGPLRAANALWAQPGFPIGEEFLRTLATQYGTGVRTVDFGSPDALPAIDAWVRERTRGRIPKLFDRLDPATRVVLANAIHFEADWGEPFRGGESAAFTRPDGSTVLAPMMHRVASAGYARSDDWQAVELPYGETGFAMWVLLPAPSGPAPVELLAPETLAAVADGLRPAVADVTLPKWESESRVDLLAAVRGLGVTDLTGFSGIHPAVSLGQATHRAAITVDEKGTEAAAATGLELPVSAGPLPVVTFRADRPFAYAIVHTATRTPAFVGTVADPTA
ncbi:serpin family protein [Phytohabitans kaempferiae]|uniref:Serpin family protein n=1 Tax=Phytohabitans kaempferiae TaxID=1620943 RepID=A0ABV6MH08_9ACTN